MDFDAWIAALERHGGSVSALSKELGKHHSVVEREFLAASPPGTTMNQLRDIATGKLKLNGDYRYPSYKPGGEDLEAKVQALQAEIAALKAVPPAPVQPSPAYLPPDLDTLDTSRIEIIGDLHCPWQHPDAWEFLRATGAHYRPTLSVQVGDELDYHGISFHDHDPDMPGPAAEMDMGRKALHELHRIRPDLLITRSNHGDLPERKMLKAGLPSRMLAPRRDLVFGHRQKDGTMLFPANAGAGWHWADNLTLRLPFGDLFICHAYGGNVNLASRNAGMSLAQGHHHSKMEVSFLQGDGGNRFALAVGTLLNPLSPAFAYGRNVALKPQIGVAYVLSGEPVLVRMPLDRHGRWTGAFLRV
jgi:hypothetical protein